MKPKRPEPPKKTSSTKSSVTARPRAKTPRKPRADGRGAGERAAPSPRVARAADSTPPASTSDLDDAKTTTFLPAAAKVVAPAPRAEPRTPARSARPKPQREGAAPGRAPTVVAQIRELEAQLDRLIDEASRRDLAALAGPDDDDDDDDDLEVTRDALPEMIARLAASRDAAHDPDGAHPTMEIPRVDSPGTVVPAPRASSPPARASGPDRASATSLAGSEATVFDTARELLSSDFYLRKWGRLAMRGRSEEVDDFGFDPIYDQKARTVLEFLYTRYFRVETTGIDRVPARGRCLLVANHSGTLPLDGVMLKTAVKLEHPSPRDVRWLTEDFIYHMPYLGSIMNRLGAVRACQENAERLLAKEQLCAVFPEGVKGIGKLFGERYRLQRFGRGGFIKLCLRTNTPIIPVAVVGAEETNPLLFKIESLSKVLGLPYVPVTPTFPALGPLGLLPAPTKWQIHFGEPIDFGAYGRDAEDDELLVGKLAERVRATIQGMLDGAVGSRKSVFFG